MCYSKKDLIDKLLDKNIRLFADGHEIVIYQVNGSAKVIIDENIEDSEKLYLFSEFYIPSTVETAYGVVRTDMGGYYTFSK